MKVLIFMLILGVVAVYALPLEVESENVNENLELFEEVEANVDFPNELIRDKRQYGGKDIFKLLK